MHTAKPKRAGKRNRQRRERTKDREREGEDARAHVREICILQLPKTVAVHVWFAGIAKYKNLYGLDANSRAERYHLLGILVTIVLDLGMTYAELCEMTGVAAIWKTYCLRSPDGSVPRERWQRESQQALAYLQSSFLANKPVKILGEVQIMLQHHVEVRRRMHEPYRVRRATTPTELHDDYLRSQPEDEIDTAADDDASNIVAAAYHGQRDVVQRFLDAGEDPNTTRSGTAIIFFAASKNHLDVARLLVEHNADLDKADGGIGASGLKMASQQGLTDMVKMLLDLKADVNSRDENKQTPLHTAAGHGNPMVVAELIAANADLDADTSGMVTHYNATPLMRAAGRNQGATTSALIAARADVNKADTGPGKDGTTALITAAKNNSIEVVEILIAAGVDLTVRNKDGSTAYDVAIQHDHAVVAKLLEAVPHG